MPITRRQFLAAATLSTAALSPPLRALAGSATTLYDKSIVIDALGGPGSMGVDWGHPLTKAQLDDAQLSGLTCTHITVGYVGTVPTLEAFETIMRSIAFSR